MPAPEYKSLPRRLSGYYAAIVATMALVVALVGVPGVTAGGLLITGKQIKRNSISSAHLKKSAVRTSDIATNAVRSADINADAVTSEHIGAGEVTPESLTLPAPVELRAPDGATRSWQYGVPQVANFEHMTTFGTYNKVDPTSVLKVEWIATASGSSCVFELRVDGQPSPGGGGQVFAGELTSVGTSALFPVAAGPRAIEVWARPRVPSPSDSGQCRIGSPASGLPAQSAVISEQIT